MSEATALLTFSLGPVHTFITQARRLADLWSGSQILSDLVGAAVSVLGDPPRDMVFPVVKGPVMPPGLPNRFVCRVPLASAAATAARMEAAVRGRWQGLVQKAVEASPACLAPVEPRHSDDAVQTAWSFVPETGIYATDSQHGAEQFAASRLFRPFVRHEEYGEKCAICGERTALPDGARAAVSSSWKEAEAETTGTALEPFFRAKQGRLCVVCLTKRLYPYLTGKQAHFNAFDAFHPDDDTSYVAVVSMDGDNLGAILGWDPGRIVDGNVEGFQRALSIALSGFASDLQGNAAPSLNIDCLEPLLDARRLSPKKPQLIYAGGEDVLFVCDVRDALTLAQAIRRKYLDSCLKALRPLLRREADIERFTISAGVLFAHTKQPAGLMLRDADHLLNAVAKEGLGRNALAVRLAKRSGAPVDAAFGWDEGGAPTLIEALDATATAVRANALASGPTFTLARDAETLAGVLESAGEWEAWIADRLSRGASQAEEAQRLSRILAPLFAARRTGALRIARFLGGEVAS